MPTAGKVVAALAVLVAAAGCARTAPTLPEDRSLSPAAQRLSGEDKASADMRLSCGQIAGELRSNRDAAAAMEAHIAGQRTRNQAALFVGGVAGAPFTEGSEAEKGRLNALQESRDRLLRISVAKNCPPA